MVHPYPLKLFVVIVALIIFNGFDPVFAQKPDISYPTPQNYTTNTPIAPLSLQNKGGNVPATTYSQVTTVAGNNKTIGSIDGTGSAASFVEPDGMAVDAAGNIYLVEVASSVVRKVTPQGVVTTFAGAGLPGNANGQGVAARFNNPKGIAIDAAGNFYVTDYTNGLIRKITPSGLVSTFAGSGAGGSKDGLGTAATFQRPTGIAIDAAGYIYVTEETNIIRRISPTGQVDRWAGSGVAGSADGTYTQASFNDPAGIAIDAVGNLYVTDRGNKLIRRITPGQVVTTIAGNGNFGATNGPALSASFSYPTGIAIDASGTIYIADWGSNLVRKLSPEGIVSTYAGNGTFAPADGIGTAAAFNLPAGVVIDSQGHLYVSEYNNNLIRFGVITGYIIDKPLPPGLVFDPTNGAITGTPTSAWPSTDYTITGYNASGSSSFVVNITVHDAAPAVQPPNITYQTPQNYTTNTPIGPLSPSNSGGAVVGIAGQVTTFAGDGTTTATDGTGTGASFSGPQLLRFDPASGNFYVVDAPNLIRKITPAGAVTTFATNFGKIQGLAIDASGSLFIADVDNNVIWKMTPGGTVTKYAGGAKGMTNGNLATAQFDGIFGLAFDSKGNLFVSDYNNRLIRKIDPGGNVTTFAGTLGVSASIDGTGTNAQFTAPDALTVDKNDNLWVADDNTLIRRVTSQGVVSTTAGNGSNLGTAQGTAAKFNGVFDLAADPAGNIYVVDNYYGLVKKITPSGLVTLVAGATPQGYNDGPLQSSHFSGALGIAFDSQGRLFITDRNNYRIREIGLSGYIIDKPMPPGLIFDQQTGIISGTPTAASPSTDYTITAFNAGGSSSFTVNITVSDPLSGLQPPNITYQTPKVYKVRKTITPLAPDNTGGAVPADAYGVSTFAGSTGSNGTFSAPYGLRTDGSGNLYVSDASQRIMKITPDGVLTVIAGSKDVTGSTNGQGTQALFNSPGQIATDLQGNIYVADINNNKIRKITPAGLVSTFAGTGATGSLNGASTTATFFHPTGVTVDAAGNVYVADHDNNVIRKITPNGTVSTFAGLAGSPGANNGNGTSARFSGPTYLAADALGNIYVADNNNQMVRKISPSGDVTTLAGNGSVGFNNGAGINATFKGLGGLTTDIYGNVYVVDKGNYVVRKITPGGVVSTFAGSGVKGAVNGDPLTAKFAGSTDITIDDEGNLYLADGGQVRKIITGGYTIDKPLPLGLNFDATTGVISGTPAAASPATDYVITAYNLSGSSSFIIRITVDPADANIIQPPNISYITPQVYTATKIIGPLIPANTGGAVPTTVYGQVSTFAGSGTPGAADGLGKAASFSYPIAIALDPAGNFYVTETVNSLLRQITPGAAVSTFAGKAGKTGYADGQGAAALFASPNGVAVDGAGNIYIADALNNRIRKITPGGLVSTYAGNGAAGSTNGAALQASFNNTTGLAIDVSGNLYVVDQKNNLIREISAGGTVSTFAGNGSAGNANGPALQASFNQPQGIAVDAAGNVYVSDQNYIRKITPGGTVSIFAGSGAQGSADGLGTAASFNHPYGITVDPNGNLYIADTGNDLIRKITPQGKVTTVAGDLQDPNNTDKNFNQPTGIVLDATGNAFITEFWGGQANNNTQGNMITKLTLTGYVIDKALPAGLVFDSTTGTISGTPASPSPATDYTITAYNGGGSSSFTVNITVLEKVLLPAEITFESTAFKTYGDDDFDPGATSTNTEVPINYQSDNPAVATMVNGLIHITGAGTATITASQDANADYLAATPVTQLLTVNQASLVIAADDQQKFQGEPNPELTVSYYGFVYNEDKSVFTKPLTISTTATTNSAIGQYPIMVGGAEAANYTITFLPGTLTVSLSPLAILIPNAFSPNGDGVNDQWHIDKLTEAFPQCLVSIYTRGGSLVFQSRGYSIPWDGSYKGTAVPFGTYYYVIDPQPGAPKLSGYVAVLR